MIKIGIVDSGFATRPGRSASFFKEGRVQRGETDRPCVHGEVIASLIRREGLELYSAQVFHESLRTSPQQVADALEYLTAHGVSLIHMSLGMRTDHARIRERCHDYLSQGGLIVASTPTQGVSEVYPAAYGGVIRVCADGRCLGDDIRVLARDPLRLGASPLSADPSVRGSSVAAARVSGVIASLLLGGVASERIVETLLAGEFA